MNCLDNFAIASFVSAFFFLFSFTCNEAVFGQSDNYLFIKKWGTEGTDDGKFNEPKHLVVDNTRNIVYVADTKNNRVQVFDTDGKFLKKWGSEGEGEGRFNDPEHIAVDSNGPVYVTDAENHNVQKFTLKE